MDVEPEPVAGRIVEILAHPEVAFGGEDGGVAEGELDLLQGGLAFVGEFGEGAAQIGVASENGKNRTLRVG